jgi:ribonuclease HI
MITMLPKKTQTTIIVEVKMHANIEGNEHADKLANLGTQLPHWTPLHSY